MAAYRTWFRLGIGVSRRKLLAIWMICAAMMAAPVLAQSWDVQRREAIQLWLSGNDLEALQRFASLALDGDADAQLLLGLIDKSIELQGPELVAMPRAERIALLRMPGGLSGRNWVHAAAEQGNSLAIAWRDLWTTGTGLETAETFAALNEPQALAETLLTLVARRDRGFDASTLAAGWYPQTLLILSKTRRLGDVHADILHPGDPQQRYGKNGAPSNAALQDWLLTAPLAMALRETCHVICPETQVECTVALYAALGSYETLSTHGSPVNALIPNEIFVKSQRGRSALARRIMLMRSARMREADRVRLAEVSSCASDWLGAQFDTHTARKIPAPD